MRRTTSIIATVFLEAALLLATPMVTAATAESCGEILAGPSFEKKLTDALRTECGGATCSTDGVVKSLNKSLPFYKVFQGKSKTVIAVTSILVGTSAAIAAINGYVGPDYPMLAQGISAVLAPITTMGLVVFGAPIWEPLVSSIRNQSFRVDDAPIDRSEKVGDLEEQFFKTNRALSRNAQQMRSVIALYTRNLTTQTDKIRKALDNTKRSTAKTDPDYQHAVGRMAEVYRRFRLLYPDIDPHDEIILDAIHVSFEYIRPKMRRLFAKDVTERILVNANKQGSDFHPAPYDVEKTLSMWMDIRSDEEEIGS